jgi:hypothetical protein
MEMQIVDKSQSNLPISEDVDTSEQPGAVLLDTGLSQCYNYNIDESLVKYIVSNKSIIAPLKCAFRSVFIIFTTRERNIILHKVHVGVAKFLRT